MYETPSADPINDTSGISPRWGITEANVIVGSQIIALAVVAGIYGGVAVAFAIVI